MYLMRQRQIDALSEAATERFVDRLCGFLRQNCSALVRELDDSLLRRRVRLAVAKASRHGLSSQCALARFVLWMFLYGPVFDTHREISRLLNDQTVEPNARIELVRALVLPHEWRAAQRLCNPGSWIAEEKAVFGTGIN